MLKYGFLLHRANFNRAQRTKALLDYLHHFEPKDFDVITENDTGGGAGAGEPRKKRRDPLFSDVLDMFEDSKISK